jgi:hypothetical protein
MELEKQSVMIAHLALKDTIVDSLELVHLVIHINVQLAIIVLRELRHQLNVLMGHTDQPSK